MWKFLFICAIVIGVQEAKYVNHEPEDRQLLKNLRGVLDLLKQRQQSDDTTGAAGPSGVPLTQEDTIVDVDDSSSSTGTGSSTDTGDGPNASPSTDMNHSTNNVGDGSYSEDVSYDESQVLVMLTEQFPGLFTKYAKEVEDVHTELSPVLSVVSTQMVSSTDPGFEPCAEVVQMIGALRYLLTSGDAGMYDTIRTMVEQVLMDPASPITSAEASNVEQHIREILWAIWEPLFTTLSQLECQIGIKPSAECPSTNDITTDQGPLSSPSEQLYQQLEAYLENASWETKSIGELMAGIVTVGHQYFETKYSDMKDKCHASVDSAPVAIKDALQNVQLMFAYERLYESIRSVIPDQPDIARQLTNQLISEHFVDQFLGVKEIQGLMDMETTGNMKGAVIALNAHVLGMIYEKSSDTGLIDSIMGYMWENIDQSTMLAPLYTLDKEAYISGARYAVEAVIKNWKSPCLNARMLGLIAGTVEAHKLVAVRDTRVHREYIWALNEMGLSVLNEEFKRVFDEIVRITIKESFGPISDSIHNIVGRQPSEVAFFEIEQALVNHDVRISKVQDMIELVITTVVPLLGHNLDPDETSPFKCEISDDELVQIMEEAHSLVHTSSSSSESKMELVNDLILASFPLTSQDKVANIASRLVRALSSEILQESITTLEEFHEFETTKPVESMIDYLAVNYGSFLYTVLRTHPDSRPPIYLPTYPSVPQPQPTQQPGTGVMPTSLPGGHTPTPIDNAPIDNGGQATAPMAFLMWQDQMLRSLVSEYITKTLELGSETMRSLVSDSSVCQAWPQLCEQNIMT